MLRRQLLERHAERQRVRQAVADSLAQTVRSHLRHPFGASTTSRTSLEEVSQDETPHRGLTHAPAPVSEPASAQPRQTPVTQREAARTGEETRWAVYNEIVAARFARSDQEWEPFLSAPARRVEELLDWPESVACPRWRLIEAWTIAAHGPHMALAGGFRLAFWSEQAEHHGPRLERALARYERFSDARPPGWPASPVAALARFLCGARAPPGRARARDGLRRTAVQRADQADVGLRALPARPRALRAGGQTRRPPRPRPRAGRAAQPAAALPPRRARPGGAAADRAAAAGLRAPGHQAAGRTLYASAQRELRLEQRDERLLAGRHPGDADGRYRAAYRYAQQWGLPLPAGRREGTAA